MSHTPGPWGYDAGSMEVFADNDQHGSGWIALVKGNDSDSRPLPADMQEANAHLIAAAPDLLAALTDLFRQVLMLPADVRWAMELRLATEAIAKAEGRGE